MRIAKAAGLFLSYGVWRIAGLRAAGRFLVRALGAPDDDIQMIAGMLLVRSGKRTTPLLEEALERRENLPMVLEIGRAHV